MSGATDTDLMNEVSRGRTAALAELFERHHRPLYRFFLRMTGDGGLSEDLAQEVFFRVLKYKDTYHPDRPFLAWMYQIARNLMTDTARKRKFEVLPGDFEVVSGDDGAEEEMARSQEISLLRRALAKLPMEKREVLVLSRFQNLKYEEIAAMLGCEVNTVKVRVYRAVRALGENYRQLAGERAV